MQQHAWYRNSNVNEQFWMYSIKCQKVMIQHNNMHNTEIIIIIIIVKHAILLQCRKEQKCNQLHIPTQQTILCLASLDESKQKRPIIICLLEILGQDRTTPTLLCQITSCGRKIKTETEKADYLSSTKLTTCTIQLHIILACFSHLLKNLRRFCFMSSNK